MYKIQGDHFSDRYSFSFRTECGYESLTPHICYTMKKLFPIYQYIIFIWHGMEISWGKIATLWTNALSR